jgi:hypothetical protein
MTIHMVFIAVKLLNHFPPKGGISDTVSPKTIMTGETLDYKKHFSLQLGQYCQVHEEDTPRNSQLPRTQGAICLGPSGNIQDGFKFMSLTTGKRIARRTWDIIPMPQTVIDRVNKLGKDQPEQFIFTNRKGHLIGDMELPSSDEDDDLTHDDHAEIPGVDRGELRPHKKSRQRSPTRPSSTSHGLRLTSYPMTIKNMNPCYSLQSPPCKNPRR